MLVFQTLREEAIPSAGMGEPAGSIQEGGRGWTPGKRGRRGWDVSSHLHEGSVVITRTSRFVVWVGGTKGSPYLMPLGSSGDWGRWAGGTVKSKPSRKKRVIAGQ